MESSGLLSLYSEVHSVNIRWLWYPFIAYGKITLIQGDPGDGKSTMMMHLIAAISTGGVTPDGKSVGAPQNVIYQCSEDGIADTIKPRLIESGADCTRIAFINEENNANLTLDDERIREAMIAFRPSLLVIDPIQAYVENDTDLQVAGRVRRLLRRLGMWANMYKCAIVLIGHMNKKENSKNLYRGLGSIDVIAAARSVLQVDRDEENPNVRIVKQIKNSLAPTGDNVRFEINPNTGFRWMECVSMEGYRVVPSSMFVKNTKERATELIKQYLSDGDKLSVDMFARLQEEGISHRTAESVKKELGIRSYRKMRQWYWSIGPGKNTADKH